MDKTVLITAGILALLGVFALNVKQLFTWIWHRILDNLFYSLKIEESSQFFYAVQNFVAVERKSRVRNYYYRTIYDNFIDGETTRDIHVFYNRGLIFTRINKYLIIISKNNDVINNTMTPYKNEKQSFQILAFKKEALQEFVDHIKARYVDNNIRYYFNNNGDVMMYGNITNKTFDNIFLNDNRVEKIKDDVKKFLNSQSMYRELGLKYKRTYLFYGSAGGGKSSLATAIANYSKRDILAVNLSKDMTDATLISLMGKRPPRSIVLFEDIDCLFEELNRVTEENKDEEKKEKTQMMKITLSCLLNILDGSFTPDDVIFVITTNHIEKLDAALKRDGRINVLMEIDLPNKETKIAYLKHLAKYNKNFNPDDINLDDNLSISTLEKNLF